MFAIASLVPAVLPGPLGAVVGGMLTQIVPVMTGGAQGGGDMAGALKDLTKTLQGLFDKIGGQQNAQSPFSQQPLPFSNSQMNPATAQNPLSQLNDLISQLSNLLNQLMQRLQGQGQAQGAGNPFSGGSNGSVGGGSASGSAFSGGGVIEGGGFGGGQSTSGLPVSDGALSKLDSMFDQAEKLMQSDKPSDQLKAQMLMQKATRMYETISKMMQQRSEAQAKAIQAIK